MPYAPKWGSNRKKKREKVSSITNISGGGGVIGFKPVETSAF
jgi:hypothetical protein